MNPVVIIDDDAAVRQSLKFLLELDGLNIQIYGDGAEALANPNLLSADCIVLDLKMPRMDGFELLDALQGRGPMPPVILITARATDAVCRRAAALGVRKILEKPLLDEALLDSIHDVMGHIPSTAA